jgi:hypothetical protein
LTSTKRASGRAGRSGRARCRRPDVLAEDLPAAQPVPPRRASLGGAAVPALGTPPRLVAERLEAERGARPTGPRATTRGVAGVM